MNSEFEDFSSATHLTPVRYIVECLLTKKGKRIGQDVPFSCFNKFSRTNLKNDFVNIP